MQRKYDCVTLGNWLNINCIFQMSVLVSVSILYPALIYVTPIMCKDKAIAWHLGLGWILICDAVYVKCHFCVSLHFISSLHFVPSLHFTPSLQSAFCSLHFILTGSQNGGQEDKMAKFCEEYLNVWAFYSARLHPDHGRTYSWKMLVCKQDFVFGSDQESPS